MEFLEKSVQSDSQASDSRCRIDTPSRVWMDTWVWCSSRQTCNPPAIDQFYF